MPIVEVFMKKLRIPLIVLCTLATVPLFCCQEKKQYDGKELAYLADIDTKLDHIFVEYRNAAKSQ